LIPILAIVAAFLKPSNAALIGLILAPAAGMAAIYLYAAIDAFQTATRLGGNYTLKDFNRPLVYLLLIAVGLIYPIGITVVVKSLVFEAFYVAAGSMSPSLQQGDRILVNKLVGREQLPDRGDVVAFRNPGSGAPVFVKRVIAIAGDTVELREGEVWVNGKSLTRDPVPAQRVDAPAELGEEFYIESNADKRYPIAVAAPENADSRLLDYAEIEVPDRSVFLLGDNRDISLDSRKFGFIHARDVVGHVQYIFLPVTSWSRFGAFEG
jgi:signal peptidase I